MKLNKPLSESKKMDLSGSFILIALIECEDEPNRVTHLQAMSV